MERLIITHTLENSTDDENHRHGHVARMKNNRIDKLTKVKVHACMFKIVRFRMTWPVWEGTIHKKQAEIHQHSEKLTNQWLRTC